MLRKLNDKLKNFQSKFIAVRGRGNQGGVKGHVMLPLYDNALKNMSTLRDKFIKNWNET